MTENGQLICQILLLVENTADNFEYDSEFIPEPSQISIVKITNKTNYYLNASFSVIHFYL